MPYYQRTFALAMTLLIPFLWTVLSAQAGQVQLAWDAPTTTTDGTPLTDLAGYMLYYWQSDWLVAESVDVGNQTTYTLTGLEAGEPYTIAVTAYNMFGDESDFSAVITVTASVDATQTVPLTIASGADDGREIVSIGAVILSDPMLFPGVGYLLAFRFTDVAIPPGAVIDSAVLELYSVELAETSRISIRSRGEASEDSLPLTAAFYDLSDRPKTTAFVDDTPAPWMPDSFNPSPDLTAILQEIVDHPQWASGNSLTLFITDNVSPSIRLIGSFESDPSPTQAAALTILYTE